MTDLCGVRWGTHSCRYENDGHLVGVDCECRCADTTTPEYWDDHHVPTAGYPYAGADHTDFLTHSHHAYGPAAQQNFGHAIRWGPA